jgi:RNA polymerase sigma-70 factor (ECF subfamily)
MSDSAVIIAGTPTGTAAAVKIWLPMGRELWWLPRNRLSNGEAMPDRAALIEAQIPGLRRFACALLRGDPEGADDLVQDTLERALAHWNLRRNQGNLKGWLYTILYNRFLSNQHRVRRRGPHDVLTEETELLGIDGGQHSVLEHRDLLRAFAALPEEQRAVLLLIGVEELSYQDAARVLGVPIGTVMSRLSRGRERLRRAMHGELEENTSRYGAALRRVK